MRGRRREVGAAWRQGDAAGFPAPQGGRLSFGPLVAPAQPVTAYRPQARHGTDPPTDWTAQEPPLSRRRPARVPRTGGSTELALPGGTPGAVVTAAQPSLATTPTTPQTTTSARSDRAGTQRAHPHTPRPPG